MTTKKDGLSVSSQPAERKGDSTKLVSLLALAAGATAMPQSGNADIIVNDSSPGYVGFSGGFTGQYDFDLPGTVQFGLRAHQVSTSTSTGLRSTVFRYVTAGTQGGALAAGVQGSYSAVFLGLYHPAILPQNQGAPWSSALAYFANGLVGVFGSQYSFLSQTFSTFYFPDFGYDHLYMGFVFEDSTSGNALRYGWAELGLTIGANLGPDVTIYRYAYDPTGTPIAMGAVPEPSSVSLLALGALAFGARGVRAWRRNRPAKA